MKLITLITSVGKLQIVCFRRWDTRTAVSYLCPITEYCCEGGCCIDDAFEIRLRWIAGFFLVALLIVVVMYGLHWICEVRKCVCGITGPREVLIKAAQRPRPAPGEDGVVTIHLPNIKMLNTNHMLVTEKIHCHKEGKCAFMKCFILRTVLSKILVDLQ
ncbi:uncharacterized protein LOC128556442 [Mercenaria mercenaria]|uniref:uncharacterized protein LOC128556442 n=1 Tax=Mercenaria mercenaria TaxID=6596 RepID=UPI00234F75AA|nr:uncharacterized protein LOC128556442 [Mercenaria mercenaria]